LLAAERIERVCSQSVPERFEAEESSEVGDARDP
jgi:hypothetical protein